MNDITANAFNISMQIGMKQIGDRLLESSFNTAENRLKTKTTSLSCSSSSSSLPLSSSSSSCSSSSSFSMKAVESDENATLLSISLPQVYQSLIQEGYIVEDLYQEAIIRKLSLLDRAITYVLKEIDT